MKSTWVSQHSFIDKEIWGSGMGGWVAFVLCKRHKSCVRYLCRAEHMLRARTSRFIMAADEIERNIVIVGKILHVFGI